VYGKMGTNGMNETLRKKLEEAKAARSAMLKDAPNSAAIPKGPPSPTALHLGGILLHGFRTDPHRLAKWVQMAHHVMGDQDDPHMAFQLQQCGFLDGLLSAFECETRTDPGPDAPPAYVVGQSLEFLFGDCWLLFTYEVLRTFRASARFQALPEAQRSGLNEIFRLLSLARMPVAKHEAAKTRKGNTYVFNAPIHLMHDGLGTMGWRVFDNSTGKMTDILRRPLADALLLCSEGKLNEQALAAIGTAGSREVIRIVKT
jgi:hypothetical protein